MSAIRVFEAAARFEHFSKAGEELRMSQAAVSYQIKSLENRLGVKLFVKDGRGVKLSGPGKLLAEDVCGAFDQLRLGFAQIFSNRETDLSIGCVSSFAYNWLQPRLHKFHAAHPDIQVTVSFLHAHADAFSDEFDIGIHNQQSEVPFRTSISLMSGKLTPVCSPEMANSAKIREPRDLLQQPLIGEFKYWQAWFKAAGIDLASEDVSQKDFAVGSLSLEATAAIVSMGFTLVPIEMYRDAIASGKLVQLFEIYSRTDRNYWLTCSKSQLYSPKIQAIRTWILDEINNSKV